MYFPLTTVLFVVTYCTSFVWVPVVQQLYGHYRVFKSVVDPTAERGHLAVVLQITSLLTVTLWGWFLSSISRWRNVQSTLSPTRFNARYLRIPFQYREKTYFYLLKIPRGVVPIQSIVNQDQVNVQEEIEPYLGPNLDCAGAKLTPADFGHRQLVFTTAMDRVITVEENETIQLIE